MRNRLIYIIWLVIGLTAFMILGYYYRQLNRSERHLAKKLRYFKMADSYRAYQELMPKLQGWLKPENPYELKEFFTQGRSYVYQTDEDTKLGFSRQVACELTSSPGNRAWKSTITLRKTGYDPDAEG